MKVSIIGGGIAGLTTAIALDSIGIKTTIFESSKSIKAVGAGLILAANAIKALKKLGIADDVIQLGLSLPSFTVYDQNGKPINRISSKTINKNYADGYVTIHRADLHNFLLSKINTNSIQINKKAISIENRNNSVTINFADDSFYETDFLIVADGIHSTIRQQLIQNSEPRYAGYICWRAVIDNPNLNLTETSETWSTKGRFGIVPLANNKIYWFACINAPQNDKTKKEFNIFDLQNHFNNFHEPIPTILKHTKNENLIVNDIMDIKPIKRYAFNNTVLIGDSAHAMTPNMGQGACQAIEDAIILAEELKLNQDYKVAFKQFENKRLKRIHQIVNLSWTMGNLAQTENKLLASLRNIVFRNIPDSITERQLKILYNLDL